jgi:hypothetical protein
LPGNECKFLGEYGLGLMTPPINNIYENGVWHKVFIAVAMIKLKKEAKNTKLYCIVKSVPSHTRQSL